MEYVIRILGRKGKLKKERFMFSSASVLDKNKIFKKLLKEQNLKHEEFLMGVLG